MKDSKLIQEWLEGIFGEQVQGSPEEVARLLTSRMHDAGWELYSP